MEIFASARLNIMPRPGGASVHPEILSLTADGGGARKHHDMNTQYRRWTVEEDAAVIAMRQLDMTSREIGRMINRSCEAVRSRLFYSLPKREKTRPESTIQTKAVPQTE